MTEYLTYNSDVRKFENLWLINYSAFFGLITSTVCLRYVNNRIFSFASVGFNILVLTTFALTGLINLAELRNSYIDQADATIYTRTFLSNIGIRYICMLFAIPLVFVNRKILERDYFNPQIKEVEKVLLNLFVIILLSSELVHWLDISHIKNSDKLALSILWSIYALAMIVRGLMKKDGVIRIMAIILFGVTIIKLFIYDISDMSTIAKTVVMMILGALLLIASFLYNRASKSSKNEK